jgi:17beta-estradiol 17-dehydrogenase / very-long-chain 3-oxoacyl-CoA reductase
MNAGMDLVFVSRTASKLEQVKEEIVQYVKEKKKRSIKVMTFAADLTNVTDEMLERFSTMIRDLDVGILVNNAGMSLDHPDYLESVDSKVNRDLISINTYAPTAVRFIFFKNVFNLFFFLSVSLSVYIYMYVECIDTDKYICS